MAYVDFGGGSDGGQNPKTFLADYFNSNEGFARGPERALMSALLFDGIQSFMNFVCAETEATRTRYKEAYNWVAEEEDDYIFSFANVCQGLGVDPNFFRKGLMEACNSDDYEWKKARRNF
jgi:hypothetical protein